MKSLSLDKGAIWRTLLDMRPFNARQRAALADKLFDLANIGAGGLVFGQLFAGGRFTIRSVVTGAAFLLVVYISSLYLLSSQELEF